MIESGRTKIPINKVDELVDAYRLSQEFILVVMRTMYPESLETILRLANKLPRIFKDVIKNADDEIDDIYEKTKNMVNN